MIIARAFPEIPDRLCRFLLSLQGGSVFADFDMDPDGCLYLVRISYDGHGCCEVERNEVTAMSLTASQRLIEMIESDAFDPCETTRILGGYFDDNKSSIWEEALQHHQLI